MKADNIINPAETDFLDKIFRQFSLDYSEFDHMEDVELEGLIYDFSQFSDKAKELSKKLFREMSECDGYVDPREIAIIDLFK